MRGYAAQIVQDPIMSRLPLALAVEPRLLPYAVANGFFMDSKARSLLFLIYSVMICLAVPRLCFPENV